MDAVGAPDRYFVVFCTTTFGSFAEAQATAAAMIAAHIARSKELHEQGVILMAGAFLDRPDEPLCTMAILTSREAAEAYMAGDPFNLNGQVREWSIREWANMFA